MTQFRNPPSKVRVWGNCFPALVAVFAFGVSGCAKLSHVDELLRLQDYARNKDYQQKYVGEMDSKFQDLLEAVRTDALKKDMPQRQLEALYGAPIAVEQLTKDGVPCTAWVYRYQLKFFDSEKVYLYFGRGDRLQSWDYVPAPE